jgi:DNA-directed RNA polymerase specialized sigma24 family protein
MPGTSLINQTRILMADHTSRPEWEEDHQSWLLHRRGHPLDAANAAFDRLTRRHWAYLCRWSRHPDAQDIVAEAFFREFAARGESPPEGYYFRPTMRMAVHNVRRNFYREPDRRLLPMPEGEELTQMAADTDAREVRLQKEGPLFFRLLKETAPDMPPETMRHVCLRAYGWSSAEIAEILDITPAAEATRWMRIGERWSFTRNLKNNNQTKRRKKIASAIREEGKLP